MCWCGTQLLETQVGRWEEPQFYTVHCRIRQYMDKRVSSICCTKSFKTNVFFVAVVFSYVIFIMQLYGLYVYLQSTWPYSCHLTCKLTLELCQMIPVREMIYTLCMALEDVGHWLYVVWMTASCFVSYSNVHTYTYTLLVLCFNVSISHS